MARKEIGLINFTLAFEGDISDEHQIDFYDVSQALIGFQRSIALTAHLVINGEIITQAPTLKGARVIAYPPAEGSWKFTAAVIASLGVAGYQLGTAPKDSPLGNIMYSAYDYVLSESLGVHVDYNKTIQQLVEEHEIKLSSEHIANIQQHKLDSLIEKCNVAITDIHRPIYKTGTATKAKIKAGVDGEIKVVGAPFSYESYEYIREEFVSKGSEVIEGKVSSYNINTYKGRIYAKSEGRPIAFELSENIRSRKVVKLITASLDANADGDESNDNIIIYCRVVRIESRSGHLKRFEILEVSHDRIQ